MIICRMLSFCGEPVCRCAWRWRRRAPSPACASPPYRAPAAALDGALDAPGAAAVQRSHHFSKSDRDVFADSTPWMPGVLRTRLGAPPICYIHSCKKATRLSAVLKTTRTLRVTLGATLPALCRYLLAFTCNNALRTTFSLGCRNFSELVGFPSLLLDGCAAGRCSYRLCEQAWHLPRRAAVSLSLADVAPGISLHRAALSGGWVCALRIICFRLYRGTWLHTNFAADLARLFPAFLLQFLRLPVLTSVTRIFLTASGCTTAMQLRLPCTMFITCLFVYGFCYTLGLLDLGPFVLFSCYASYKTPCLLILAAIA